jgi:hypothetical protein
MLSRMSLVEQWRRIESQLPADWAEAGLHLRVDERSDFERAAALLAPLAPGRSGRTLRIACARDGAGPGPESVIRALRRLDAERIGGELELLRTGKQAAAPQAAPRQSLAEGWEAALAALPEDWSDLHAEVELRSTDHLEPAALLMAPLNPTRHRGAPSFRFRVARTTGYGTSPAMARRCLERLDAAGMRGRVAVLRALSDTRHVQTQGPVWYVGGKAV